MRSTLLLSRSAPAAPSAAAASGSQRRLARRPLTAQPLRACASASSACGGAPRQPLCCESSPAAVAAQAAPAARLALLAFASAPAAPAVRTPAPAVRPAGRLGLLSAAAFAMPSLDAALDECALFYYFLLELSPVKKAILAAALCFVAFLVFFLREKVEKFMAELAYVQEEMKRQDPTAPPWWKGWHFDWNDGVEGYLKPAYAAAVDRRRAEREARLARAYALERKEEETKRLQEMIAKGEYAGAEIVRNYKEEHSTPQTDGDSDSAR